MYKRFTGAISSDNLIPRSPLTAVTSQCSCVCKLCLPDEVPDVRECLRYLRGLWPRAAFDDRLPPVVMKHQLYSLCPNRTGVDHQVVSAPLAPPSDCAYPPTGAPPPR